MAISKILFLLYFIFFSITPGLLLITIICPRENKKNIYLRLIQIIAISIGFIALVATLLTPLKIPFSKISVIISISILLLINLFKYRKNALEQIKNIISFKKKDGLYLFLIFLFGLIISGNIYISLKNQYVAPSNDVLIHQKIINDIYKNKNVSYQTVSPWWNAEAFPNLKYPYAFHTFASLLQSPNLDTKISYKTILAFTSLIPLSVFMFTFFIFKNKKISLISSFLSTSFGFYPYWTYGWGGYPLILSIIILPAFVVTFIKYLDKNTKTFNPLFWIILLIAASLHFTHITELWISSPIIIMIWIATHYKKYDLLSMIKKTFFFLFFFFILIFSTLNSGKTYLQSVFNTPSSSTYGDFKIIPINILLEKPKAIFINNNNYLLLLLFVCGFINLCLSKKNKNKNFLFYTTVLWILILIDSYTYKFLEAIYNLSSWGAWERIAYHFIYIVPPICAYFLYKKLYHKNIITIIISSLIIIVLSFSSIKNSYVRLKSVGEEYSTIKNNEYLAFEWINKNISESSVFFNYYSLGIKQSVWWLPIFTKNTITHPYTTHVENNYQIRFDNILLFLLNLDNKEKIEKNMKNFPNFNYAITSKEDSMDNLPIAYYYDNSPCFDLIYPNNNISCQYVQNSYDKKIKLTPDKEQTYIFKYNEKCNKKQKICATKINIIDIGIKNKLLPSPYLPEQDKFGRQFLWINRITSILLPEEKINSVTLTLLRPESKDVVIKIFDQNFKYISSITLDKDDWQSYKISLNNSINNKIYLVTEKTFIPENDSRELSFAIDKYAFK